MKMTRTANDFLETPRIFPASPRADTRHANTVDLVEILKILIRRRNILIVTMIVVTLGGLILTLTPAPRYSFSTAIEIGSTIDDNATTHTTVPVESPETVLAKIRESYTQQAINRYREKFPEDTRAFQISARIPENSQIIILEAIDIESKSDAYRKIMGDIVDLVLSDHRKIVTLRRANIENSIEKARLNLAALMDPSTLEVKKSSLELKILNAEMEQEKLEDPRTLLIPQQKLETMLGEQRKKLADLRDQEQLLKSRLLRADRTDKLLEKQIEELQEQIDASLRRRHAAVNKLDNESSAMTMLLIDNELQRNRNRLATLRERLYVRQEDLRQELKAKIHANRRQQNIQENIIEEIKYKLETLVIENRRARKLNKPGIGNLHEQAKKLVADHARAISRQRQAINYLETKLHNLSETHALSPPLRSAEPIGPAKKKIALLTAFLAIVSGIFAAFIFELIDKIRRQLSAN